MKYDTIRYKNGVVEILDQRFLPGRVSYLKCRTAREVYDAIEKMKIRGAPAIGIAGAFGVYLGAVKISAVTPVVFRQELRKISDYMSSSRPTARNLFWAIERMEKVAERAGAVPVSRIKKMLLSEAMRILGEDIAICRKIGKNGRALIGRGVNILTHCNAGGLATGGYGTALGVILTSRSRISKVYVDETRPVLQGARLTAWELTAEGIPATLICDNAAASIMARGDIDAVIVGADRIASNGDTANKIGTYPLAVSARYHKVPFYVAAPVSTFDLSVPDGKGIPIEERSADEVRKISGRLITVKDIPVENPAFDVTPRELITAIITEKGIIDRPDRKRIAKVLK